MEEVAKLVTISVQSHQHKRAFSHTVLFVEALSLAIGPCPSIESFTEVGSHYF